MEIHKCWYDCYQFLSLIDFIDWSGRRECERKWIAIYHVGYYITEITKKLAPLICLFISILNNAIATKKSQMDVFLRYPTLSISLGRFHALCAKIFLGISFTGIFQIPVSRSTHKRTPGFIEFDASEHHKIGSDPFQSTTAFFHLQRKWQI